jgi:hypothetical protein
LDAAAETASLVDPLFFGDGPVPLGRTEFCAGSPNHRLSNRSRGKVSCPDAGFPQRGEARGPASILAALVRSSAATGVRYVVKEENDD